MEATLDDYCNSQHVIWHCRLSSNTLPTTALSHWSIQSPATVNAEMIIKTDTHWRQSRLSPKPATNRQQSRLSLIRSTLLPIRSTLLPVLATNQQQLEFYSLSQWTLLPIRSNLSPECTGPMQHVRLCGLSTKSTVLNSTCRQRVLGLN